MQNAISPTIHLPMLHQSQRRLWCDICATNRDILSLNNLTRSNESRSPSPRLRAPPNTSDKKSVQFPDQPNTMARRVVPSVRAGAQERGEGVWRIPVSINGMVVEAVVDTSAEITIISQRVYESLKPLPGGVKVMTVRLAGDGARMTASFLVEVEIGIDEYRCHHQVYIGMYPIFFIIVR